MQGHQVIQPTIICGISYLCFKTSFDDKNPKNVAEVLFVAGETKINLNNSNA